MRKTTHNLGVLVLVGLGSCARPPPDATPEGAVRQWLGLMEASVDDAHAVTEAYGLLGPAARANLEERARRATRLQGYPVAPLDMLTGGRFALRFRPKTMRASLASDRATVEAIGDDAHTERATVHCVREAGGWRVEPDLPELAPAPRRERN